METLSAQRAELEAAMADPNLYNGDSQQLVALQKDLGQVTRLLALAEEQWMELQEQWESSQPS